MATLPFVPGRHPIDAYGGGGFRFAGMSHVGSILATPRGVCAIAAATIAEVGDEALAPLVGELAAAPGAIELLVVGTGASPARLRKRRFGACASSACASRSWRLARRRASITSWSTKDGASARC